MTVFEIVVALLKVTIPEAAIVVAAVPDPIAPGFAKVLPLSNDAFKLGTTVVDATVNGAVPVDTVLVITPEAEIVVNAPDPGVVLPMDPGEAKVAPNKELAFKFGTTVVLAIVNGEVPVDTVLVMTPEAETVVKDPDDAVVEPIGPGAARFKYPDTFQLDAVVPDVNTQVNIADVPEAMT